MLKRFAQLLCGARLYKGLMLFGFFLLLWCVYPVRSVIVYGPFSTLNAIHLHHVLAPKMQKGFFRISLENIQQRLMLEPSIHHVDLWRAWPGDFVIRLYARQPVLRWHAGGGIDRSGVLFYPVRPQKTLRTLPEYIGPQEQSAQAATLIDQIQSLIRHQKRLHIKNLQYDTAQGWSTRIEPKLNVFLGQTRLIQNFRRFLLVLPSLKKHYPRRHLTVDLRYRQGFALKFS